MRAERVVAISQTTLRDAIADISTFIEDAVTALAPSKSHSGGKSADNSLEVILQGPVNKSIEQKLIFIDLKACLLQKNEEVIPSRRQVKNITELRLEEQDFIAPVETIFKEETKKVVDAGSERKDRGG